MKEQKVIWIDINKIHPYENNPRKNDNAVEPVMNSIKAFKFRRPIEIDENNIILTGHTRLKAAKRLGLKQVPCLIYTDLTPEQKKAYRLADNKVAEFADWDIPSLEVEFSEIQDIDMTDFGFDINIPEKEFDINIKDNERTRTNNAYNLDGFDSKKAVGFYQMPILKACKIIPTDVIGFNYMLTTKPTKGTGVHFYIDDYQFERIWNEPENYLDKLRLFDCVFTPDFSLYMDMPMAMKIWNVYRSRLIGQMLQNLGANVIPTLQWAEADTFDFCFDGIEQGGVVTVSTIGVKRNKEAFNIWVEGMNEALKRLKPSCVLVYGGKVDFDFNCDVVFLKNKVLDKMMR